MSELVQCAWAVENWIGGSQEVGPNWRVRMQLGGGADGGLWGAMYLLLEVVRGQGGGEAGEGTRGQQDEEEEDDEQAPCNEGMSRLMPTAQQSMGVGSKLMLLLPRPRRKA